MPKFLGTPLKDIAGIQTYPSYCVIFRDGSPNQPISEKEAKLFAQLAGYRL